MCMFTGNLSILFPGNYAPFELRNLAKIKYPTETECQRNSSKTALQNFMKLYSYEGPTVQMCVFAGIFPGSSAPFERGNFTETVCQGNSSETDQQNFM